MSADHPYRLPRSIVPRRYELTFQPDLEQGRFAGRARIEAEVLAATDTVELNAAELAITQAVVGEAPVERVETHPEVEKVSLHLAAPAPPGPLTLEIDFTGVLNDQLRGFYRSTFLDADGRRRTVATTQFEATDARRAFPCWDEPDLKAVFAVSLIVPPELLAVSNGREVDRTIRPDGLAEVRFADTMVMSTYLVAMVVGPLEATLPVDVDGIPLRVVHQPGKGHLAGFALEAGAYFLRWFQDYYGISYPGDKVDFIAIPDFAFGAMENLGAVTFRESALLIDPQAVSQAELSRVADIIAHELAHMWFGDLVTMKWWNGVWLNEAFASFMEMKASDTFRPDWQRWLAFASEPGHERSAALEVDGLHAARPVEFDVESPAEAAEMFDALTYGKGAAVLRMLEQFMGEDDFRNGIRTYLRTHAHGNTETHHLWEALETATEHPVRSIMDSFIFQPGYPLIEVSPPEGAVHRLTQRRFLYAGTEDDTTWTVPVITSHGRLLLDGSAGELSAETALLVNAGGHGFYRVKYPPEHRARLVERLPELLPLERFILLDDAWALTLAGQASAADFLQLVEHYRTDSGFAVWQLLVRAFDELHRFVDGEARRRLEERIRRLLDPITAALGWEPADGEDELTARVRGMILTLRGSTGEDPASISSARSRWESVLEGSPTVQADIARAVVRIVSYHGSVTEYEQTLHAYRHAPSPQEERRFLAALAEFPDPELTERTFAALFDGTVRPQDGPDTIGRLLANRRTGGRAWQLMTANWQRILDTFPPATRRSLVANLWTLLDVADQVEAFFADHQLPYAERQLQQRLEMLR